MRRREFLRAVGGLAVAIGLPFKGDSFVLGDAVDVLVRDSAAEREAISFGGFRLFADLDAGTLGVLAGEGSRLQIPIEAALRAISGRTSVRSVSLEYVSALDGEASKGDPGTLFTDSLRFGLAVPQPGGGDLSVRLMPVLRLLEKAGVL